MAENSTDELKYGINWSFLKSLLDMYEHMLNDQHTFLKSLAGNSGVSPKITYSNFVASVYNFYTAVKHQFDGYLIKSKTQIKPQDYIDIVAEIKRADTDHYTKVLNLALALSHWSNSEGCFKTLTKQIDPMSPNNF